MLVEVITKKPAKPLTRLIRPALVARGSHGAAPQGYAIADHQQGRIA
jgi:LacI family transcriptional regulator